MSEQATVQNIQQPAEAPTLVWDDSAMQTHYANVCNVMGTREEMALLFGAPTPPSACTRCWRSP